MVESIIIGTAVLILVLLFLGWLLNLGNNKNTTSTNPRVNPPDVDVNIGGSPHVGQNRSDIRMNITAQAKGSKDLAEIGIELSDSDGNSWGPITSSLSGNSYSDTENLANLTGSNPTISSPKTFNYRVMVEDSDGETQQAVGHININNSGGGPPTPPGGDTTDMDIVQQIIQQLVAGNVGIGGGGAGGGPIIIGNSQQQQQQMGGSPWGGYYGGINPQVYKMFMQQMQQMQINQQQMMQQMMMFMQENNYNEINNEFMVQFMQQVMNVDIDIDEINFGDGGGQGSDSGDVEIQINQVINNINVSRIENKTIEIINKVDIDITQEIEQEINFVFFKMLQFIKQEKYEIDGDIIVIKTPDGGFEEVDISIFIQYLNILTVIKNWEIEKLVLALINQEIDINASLEVKIEQIIAIYQESEKESQKDNTIVIEDFELKPVPTPGTNSSDIYFHARCGANTKLQELMLNFDGNQKVIGLSSYSKEVKVNLRELIGDHTFQQGETHNYSVKVIDQGGHSRNRTNQLQVKAGPEDSDEVEFEIGNLEEKIDELIRKLKKERELEIASIQEKRDAIKKLKDALSKLLEDNYIGVFKAMIYFRKVDIDNSTHSEVHQKVVKIIDNINEIGSASQLENETSKAEQIMKEIEEAEHEIRDSFEKDIKLTQPEYQTDYTINEIENIVQEIRLGADKYEKTIERGLHKAP